MEKMKNLSKARKILARKLIGHLEKHPSKLFALMEIRILMNLTARAFEVPAPGFSVRKIKGSGIKLRKARPHGFRFRDPSHALAIYAAFTRQAMAEGHPDPRRIYGISYALGEKIRRWTGLSDPADRERLIFLLYRNIGIHMKGRLPGPIRVSACYFSHLYSPEECRLMSFMDSGIIAGICGGGKLKFTSRLTQGADSCQAEFRRKSDLK